MPSLDWQEEAEDWSDLGGETWRMIGDMPTDPSAPPVSFNSAQLATYNEARALRSLLNATPQYASNQILPGDDEFPAPAPVPDPNFPWMPVVVPAKPGIFQPEWGVTGGPEPSIGDAFFLHFRYANGAVTNVGLSREKFRSYPNSPNYVVDQLAAEAKAMGTN